MRPIASSPSRSSSPRTYSATSRNHPFLDGNKRVAWLACEDQLHLIRLRVAVTTDDTERLVLDVIARRMEAPEIVDWLAARLTAYDR